jgi:hypothetical protein
MSKYENIPKSPKKVMAEPASLLYIRFDVAVSTYATGKDGIRISREATSS